MGDFELPKDGLQVTLDCSQYYKQHYHGEENDNEIEERLGF
jgi:hypothetical protein